MKKTLSPLQKALNIWAFVLIIWSIYRTKFALPAWFDEFIAKPLVFVLPVILFIRKFEKKSFFESIWLTKKNAFNNIYLAILIGALLTISAIVANYAKIGKLIFEQSLFNQGSQMLILAIGIAVATSISEEILSRGFILRKLYEDSKNVYSASFLSSILFLILHIPILFTNLKLGGPLILLFLTTDFILSMVNSLIYLDGKSIIPPILIHALYNISIILYV